VFFARSAVEIKAQRIGKFEANWQQLEAPAEFARGTRNNKDVN
jgi:hypothetical protein